MRALKERAREPICEGMHDASIETANEVEADPADPGVDLGKRGYAVASAFVVLAVLLEGAWIVALAYLLLAGVGATGV